MSGPCGPRICFVGHMVGGGIHFAWGRVVGWLIVGICALINLACSLSPIPSSTCTLQCDVISPFEWRKGGWRKVSSEKEGNLMMMMMMRMVPDPHLQVLWSGELSQVLCKVLTTQPASKQWRRSRRGIMTFGNRKMRRIEFFFFHFFLSLECRANCDLISPYLEHLAFLHNT